ncbi:Sodium/hydrogen exchanger family-domain-containing protein [Boletus reticuloceps]|uniref:Sodium/hydrogen exchanger family-domain-containing protein n=1 Tax=Boletus reticuloceps TaxID=495285 RepID=A0A8I3AAQ6_9AGAM|nr:Sodium/hydrogen exchanger family-domain-containing protein [Boletus reticuloceps]
MAFNVLQVSAASLTYICLGGFVVLFSIVSLLVKEMLFINEVVLGTAFGIVIGPYAADIFDPRAWGGTQENKITLEIMRVVLATGLFAIGVELPCAYMKEHAKSLLVMVIPTMAFGWVVISAVLHALFPGLDAVSALCIAACLTPTDPVTCAAITRGRFAAQHVPVGIRRILSAESAANDGLAYPFLSIAIYLTVETSTRVAIGKWFLIGWLYEVILGTVLGAVLGLTFSNLMKISHRKGFIDRESYIAQYLALSIFTIGVASSIGVDDLLASFAAGCAISWDGHFNVQTADDSFSSVIDYVLNCGCFIYIGAWLPFKSYDSPELGIAPWRLVVLMLAILIFRRIPPLLLLYRWIPEIASWKEALFSGHFGMPTQSSMGVSAVFVSALALTRLPVPENPPASQAQLLAATIQPIVSFVVLGSIIVHGLSIPFFTLGRGVHSRTATLTYTWTRTRTGATLPDWVLSARRPGDVTSPPAVTGADTDVEHGMETNGKCDPMAQVRPDQTTGGGSPSQAEVAIPVSSMEEVGAVTIVTDHDSVNGNGDVAAESAQVIEENHASDDVEEATLKPKLVRFPSTE